MNQSVKMESSPVIQPMAVYRFTLQCERGGVMPGYAGSALRGAFGHALRRVACMTKAATCQGCPLVSTCPYTTIFENARPSGADLATGKDVPNPYVIQTAFYSQPWRIEAGERWAFDMMLTGAALSQLPLIIYCWQEALKKGLTTRDIPFRLTRVECFDQMTGDDDPVWIEDEGAVQAHLPGVIPVTAPASGILRIAIQTPMRLQAKRSLVHPQDFKLEILIGAIGRRYTLMADCHMADAGIEWDLIELKRIASELSVESRLTWRHWTRHSNRQQRDMDLNGLMGDILISGNWAPLWPLLYLGQWLHVGKNTAFGLGGYHLTIE
ncbi:MAG: CRISPR system precrRNA processing endoribonuclease RAMP protein Cas6 [Hahellaceae bacterium]|nr:CRISPR system precrRNA processing endoribonuclease RAMP protein Cas6 [Hahellaceae bacterium]